MKLTRRREGEVGVELSLGHTVGNQGLWIQRVMDDGVLNTHDMISCVGDKDISRLPFDDAMHVIVENMDSHCQVGQSFKISIRRFGSLGSYFNQNYNDCVQQRTVSSKSSRRLMRSPL